MRTVSEQTASVGRMWREEADPEVEALRAELWAAGRTTADLAGASRLCVATVARFMSGEVRKPQHHTLHVLARVVGWRWKLVPAERTLRRVK